MNIGILSTAGIMCGVAEYGHNLALSLRARGHEVTIFGSRGGDRILPEHRHRLLPAPDEPSPVEVVPCFDPPAWTYSGEFDQPLLQAEIRRRAVTAVIVQYQAAIYDTDRLEAFLAWCRGCGVKTIVTYHDSCIVRPLAADVAVVHGESLISLLPGSVVIPQGVHDLPDLGPVEARRRLGLAEAPVATLGLGRTRYEVVLGAVERLGWNLLVLDPTGACQVRSPRLITIRRWLGQRQMIETLMAARAIVLWYPPVDALVTSSAAQVALASHRPVVVTRAATPRDLIATLSRGDNPEWRAAREAYIRVNSWNRAAERYEALLK